MALYAIAILDNVSTVVYWVAVAETVDNVHNHAVCHIR